MKLSDLTGFTDEQVDQLVEQVIEITKANNDTNGLFRDVFALAKTLQPGEAMFVGFVLHGIYNQLEEVEDE